MWSTFVHRWRRPILHAIAGGAIVGSGAVGMSRGPSPLTAGDTAASQVEVLQAQPLPVQDSMAASPPVIQPSPAPTPDVVEDPATTNAAAPSAPDAPLAMRAYTVEEGDSVRTIAAQFSVTNETIIWQNDLTDPDIDRKSVV